MNHRLVRCAILMAGIVIPQAVLYGPSLLGRKILLPLDLLAQPGILLPRTPALKKVEPHNPILTDLVYSGELHRRFAAEEMRAGRLPWWVPYHYGGVPSIWCKLAPFRVLDYLFPSPVVLAWQQMLLALIAGSGVYVFVRKVLAVSFWPAAVVAWCYPLTAFFVLWQGYPPTPVVVWLPWLLWAVEGVVQRPWGWSGPVVAAFTAAVVVSGQLDISAQALLVSGVYGAGRLLAVYWKRWLTPPALGAGVALSGAWLLGICLALPQLLPMMEYTPTGARLARRTKGAEERPPVGPSAMPLSVLPEFYGCTQHGSLFLAEGNRLESAAGAYAGLLAALFLAPLAFCSRRHRPFTALLIAIALLGVSWQWNIPGLVDLLRMPGLNMMSHNRLVFATALAVVLLAAIGLDVLWREPALARRWWFWLAPAIATVLGAWCLFRAAHLPEPVATQIRDFVAAGRQAMWITDLARVDQLQWWFVRMYLVGALVCSLAVTGWLVLWYRSKAVRWTAPVVATLWLVELLWYAYGVNPQCDPALYYPKIPVLQAVAHSVPGRVIGYQCLPAILAASQGLNDIRGYDSVDPMRMVDLILRASDPQAPQFPYALTEVVWPKMALRPPGVVRLSPILDLLNVRYVIFRGTPPAGLRPDFQGDDYWVMTNTHALPRAFVPARVEVVEDDAARLQKMDTPDFDPSAVAYAETPVELPSQCRGTATITSEIPTRVQVAAEMETPGLVVLADRWDPGWRAYLDGRETPILRVDHAIRGVVVPAGESHVDFRYEPNSLKWGLRLAALSLLISLGWAGVGVWRQPGGAGEIPVPAAPEPSQPRAGAQRQSKSQRGKARGGPPAGRSPHRS